MRHTLQIFFVLFCLFFFGTGGYAQIIKAVDDKGSIKSIENSKWLFSTDGKSIYNTALNKSVGIGTSTVDGSAILDISSTSKGFLPPRMTTDQRTAIATAAIGLCIFNTDSNAFEVNIGTVDKPSWQSIADNAITTEKIKDGTISSADFNATATIANASNTTIIDAGALDATVFPTFVTAVSGNLPQQTASTKLLFNPKSGILTATKFAGDGSLLTGIKSATNADLTGDVTSTGNVTLLSKTDVIAGSYGSASMVPVVTVDSKGRLTSVTATAISAATDFTGSLSGDVSGKQDATVIGDNKVTTAKINTEAVTTAKIAAASVTYAKIQNIGASSLLGNATTADAIASNITLGTGLSFTGNVLNSTAGTLTGVTGTAPILSSGGNAPVISIAEATTTAAGSMSSADKTKLDNIATGATANTGTVTSASVVTANGVSGTVTTATTTPAITVVLGDIIPKSVVSAGALTGTILTSTASDGTAPFVVTSKTAVANLSIGGNAATATKADTVTTIPVLSGDITSTGNATTLSITGVTAGSYGSASTVPVVTVDSKGRVTSVTNTPITAATDFTGSLSGDVSGKQGATVIGDNRVTTAKINAEAVTTAKIAAAAVTYAKIQNIGAGSLLGNATIADAIASNITLGTGLSFTGNVLNSTAGTLTGVTGTAPILSSGGNAPVISIAEATTTAAGSMSSADKTKLDNIATGATANTGTVTSASVVTANGVSGTVTTATTTPAITVVLGDIIPKSVVSAGALTGTILTSTASDGTAPFVVTSKTAVANLSIGGNAATATKADTVTTIPVLSGAVTNTGNVVKLVDNAVIESNINTAAVTTAKIADLAVTTAKIADAAVTYAKMQLVSPSSLLGNPTTADAAPKPIKIGTGLNLSTLGELTAVSGALSIKTVSAAYAILSSDYTILCNAASAFTLTLPDVVLNKGAIYVIRKTDETANVLTFSASIYESETTSFTTLNYNKTIRIQSNGANWFQID